MDNKRDNSQRLSKLTIVVHVLLGMLTPDAMQNANLVIPNQLRERGECLGVRGMEDGNLNEEISIDNVCWESVTNC